MKDIKKLIYGIVTGDATFISLTGATANDKRLYYQFPPEEISESNPWCTYFFTTSGIVGAEIGDVQVPDIILTVDIWGKDSDEVDQVFDQLIILINRRYGENSDNHRIVLMKFDGFNDIVEDEPEMESVYHKNTRWNLGWILES